MTYTWQQLETQYRNVVAQLGHDTGQLAAALDRSVPFYRGEDVRNNHVRRLQANVLHYAKRIAELIEALDQCSMTD
jgi:hypothetical protein